MRTSQLMSFNGGQLCGFAVVWMHFPIFMVDLMTFLMYSTIIFFLKEFLN